MSSAFPFKVAIFDLDFTLWDSKILYEDVFEILYCLQQSGIKMYVVSYNSNAKEICKYLGIVEFFHDIYNQRNIPKSHLINHIAKLNKVFISKNNVFFDDDIKNINDVTKYGCATAVHIKDGLKWKYVPSLPLTAPLNSRIKFAPLTAQLSLNTVLEETIIEVAEDDENNKEPLEIMDDDELYTLDAYADLLHETNIYESKLLE